MLLVRVHTNAIDETITQDITSSPAKAFEATGVDPSTSMVTLKGQILDKSRLNTTFEDLAREFGFADGASINLNAIVKADGANN